ncbi:MAG: response regulator [Bacteroidota bacterium]
MENIKIKILAVDDNRDNLISLKALIREAFPEATLLTASDGSKGIELAVAEDPDVILLDILMPGMDGFEVCRKLKTGIKLSDIPVVFVTALKGDRESRIRALEAGAEAFLAKPIDESELTAQIRAMVKIKTANTEKRDEKKKLTALVAERTRKLEEELAERLRVEAELVKAKNKAEESDRLKSVFLANMSHEIRTPMNAIAGFAGILAGTDVSEEERTRFSEIILSRSDDLMQIIDNILEISRIESGNAAPVKSVVNINTLLREIESIATRRMERLNKSYLSLSCIIPTTHEDVHFMSDPWIIKRVFINLIDNAIKFTHSGSVRFGYQLPKNGTVNCFVTDTGIGISPENHSLIFEHFRQVETPDPHQYGGTGLGLSICKGSLALLGGEIRLESEPGKGSTFFFSLPCHQSEISMQDLSSAIRHPQSVTSCQSSSFRNWSGKKILLVEDDEMNMEFLKVILKNTGADLVGACNGREVRNCYDRLDTFSLVLLDIRLPDTSGLDLAKEIKNISPYLPVIAQTAYALSADRKMSEEAGCDGYISKPIRKSELYQLIDKFMSQS